MRNIALSLVLVLVAGCFRTHYENFSPANPDRAPETQEPFKPRRGTWQHFFIYGLVPDERFINAREICATAENIQAIETRRTFAEGLVAAFAGYYINIYSPWDGKVLCKQDPALLLH